MRRRENKSLKANVHTDGWFQIKTDKQTCGENTQNTFCYVGTEMSILLRNRHLKKEKNMET